LNKVPETLDELAIVLKRDHLDPKVSAEDDYLILEWFMESAGYVPMPDLLETQGLYTYQVGDFSKIILPALEEYNEKGGLKRND
jgi:hypothetical protein